MIFPIDMVYDTIDASETLHSPVEGTVVSPIFTGFDTSQVVIAEFLNHQPNGK